MALKDTIKHMRDLLSNITQDLEKADNNGNKAASQRVRTGTVKLEKVAKLYRKESIKSEKTTKGQKKPAKKAASKAKSHGHAHSTHKSTHKSAHKSAAHKTQSSHKSTAKKTVAKPKAKAAARPRALSVKKPTAKLPTRRFH